MPVRDSSNPPSRLHIMSFMETQSERGLNIQRLQLNETIRDTEFVYYMSEVEDYSVQENDISGMTPSNIDGSPYFPKVKILVPELKVL